MTVGSSRNQRVGVALPSMRMVVPVMKSRFFLAVLHTGDKTFIIIPTSTASSQAAESHTVSAAGWRAVSSHDGSVAVHTIRIG
jgi:hypothetical protein